MWDIWVPVYLSIEEQLAHVNDGDPPFRMERAEYFLLVGWDSLELVETLWLVTSFPQASRDSLKQFSAQLEFIRRYSRTDLVDLSFFRATTY